MPVAVECKCGKKLKVPDGMAGKKGKCPACGEVFVIPTPSAPGSKTQPLPASGAKPAPKAEVADQPTKVLKRKEEPAPKAEADEDDAGEAKPKKKFPPIGKKKAGKFPDLKKRKGDGATKSSSDAKAPRKIALSKSRAAPAPAGRKGLPWALILGAVLFLAGAALAGMTFLAAPSEDGAQQDMLMVYVGGGLAVLGLVLVLLQFLVLNKKKAEPAAEPETGDEGGEESEEPSDESPADEGGDEEESFEDVGDDGEDEE